MANRFAWILAALIGAATPALANGIGENGAWQFQTNADKVAKGAIVDLVERKKGNYYHSFQNVNNIANTTYIDRQFNCGVTATASGNSGSNGMTANTSSPTVNNTGSTSASTAANSASNGLSGNLPSGVINDKAVLGAAGSGQLSNSQSNAGSLGASVSGSASNAVTGAVTAGGGRSDLALNSEQQNQGGQQMASVAGSTACTGALN
ncbi:MAG: hypothetical protein EOO25_07535 [Comamonadaceae bacterium]|nr:MAG: hypothetical protein EOO25_07535 [Comamonadaceae bacterium]